MLSEFAEYCEWFPRESGQTDGGVKFTRLFHKSSRILVGGGRGCIQFTSEQMLTNDFTISQIDGICWVCSFE